MKFGKIRECNKIWMLLIAITLFAAGCGKETNKDSVNSPEVENSENIENSETIENNEVVENDGAVTEETVQESDPETAADDFSFEDLEDYEFYFLSGAGGWRTFLNIDAAGSFAGEFSDSDMGTVGEDYPNGTYYLSKFTGKFAELKKVNDYTYSTEVAELSTVQKMDTEEIIDGMRYYYCEPYGIDGAEEVLIFLPGAPINELPEEYLDWVRTALEDPAAETLPFYGLYNVKEQNGFYSYRVNVEETIAVLTEWAKSLNELLANENLTQQEMNEASAELYATWDSALNILWKELKEEMPEDEFGKLLDEQREWIKDKETAVVKAGAGFEGGSMYSLIVNMEAANITEKRVYELYEIYQKLQ